MNFDINIQTHSHRFLTKNITRIFFYLFQVKYYDDVIKILTDKFLLNVSMIKIEMK